ncbi:MAG: GDSL-type esterase/lipase family protein [Victivallaceae bacterium]|nr:GDSL-type esterase/lipase family protein [Victivallaceae bacterium]
MNRLKIIALLCGALFLGANHLFALELEFANDNWSVTAKTYQAKSKNGYLNSLKVDGKEFLTQEKVAAGSYLCQGKVPPLKNLKKVDDKTITGSNVLGTLTYTFTDKDITCSFTNKDKKSVAFYFIMSKAINTVIVNGSEMLEVPVKARGKSFKWIQGKTSVEFQAKSSIWGPWKGCQVFQIRPAPGKTGIIKIIPGKVLDTASFNKQQKKNSQATASQPETGQTTSFDYSATAASKQLPLCMIGDSITWSGKGDYWRKELLKRMPNVAFIGTHTAVLGYSHAGEGGDSTGRVLNRIKALPDCPYYSLLIGTNNNGVKTKELVKPKAKETAQNIIRIVNALLKKNGVKKVFLSSILPCSTKNPLRDECNSATNKILRAQFSTAFPAGNVVWVEYEKPLRKIDGWEKKIRLHPSKAGYALIADIMAKTICSSLDVKPNQLLTKPANSGVRVVNLMKDDLTTGAPVIAGWYTLSFKVTAITGDYPEVILQSTDSGKRFSFKLVIPVKTGKRISKNFFTKYERYGYSRVAMKLQAVNCKISAVLLEKSRPSMKPSVYGKGAYIDTVSPTAPGELLEYKK